MQTFPNISVIGDSHVGAFSPYCRLCTLGPVTMYSLTTDKLNEYIVYLLERKEIDVDGWWIFCTGEIDVRCLLHKQINEYGRKEDETIETLVDNYISNLHKLNHTKLAISTTVAPAKTEGFEVQQKYTINSDYPFKGSDQERSRWSKKLNHYLINKCIEKNITYLDIYSLFKDDEGFLDHQYIDADMIHVSKNDKIVTLLNNLY
jgi:hypothetical protein